MGLGSGVTYELLIGCLGLFSLLKLVSATLLKINHRVIAHLVARAMLTQDPARKLDP